jgi:hypothetical protein
MPGQGNPATARFVSRYAERGSVRGLREPGCDRGETHERAGATTIERAEGMRGVASAERVVLRKVWRRSSQENVREAPATAGLHRPTHGTLRFSSFRGQGRLERRKSGALDPEPGIREAFTRMSIHELPQAADGDRAEAAPRAGVWTHNDVSLNQGRPAGPAAGVHSRTTARGLRAAQAGAVQREHRGATCRVFAPEWTWLLAECRRDGYRGCRELR